MTPDELAKMIPPEVVEATRSGFYNATGPTNADDWRTAIAAGLAAWPGMIRTPHKGPPVTAWEPYLVLPLQEARDE